MGTLGTIPVGSTNEWAYTVPDTEQDQSREITGSQGGDTGGGVRPPVRTHSRMCPYGHIRKGLFLFYFFIITTLLVFLLIKFVLICVSKLKFKLKCNLNYAPCNPQPTLQPTYGVIIVMLMWCIYVACSVWRVSIVTMVVVLRVKH